MSKTKWYTKPTYLLFALALVLSLSAAALIPQVAQAQAWPSSWITIDLDPNEDGAADNLRDVQTASYNFDDDYLYLRLCLYGTPDFAGPSRYKWFFDLGVGDNLHFTGNNIFGAEYLLFVEDTDNNGTGEVYLLHDTNGDGEFSEYELPFHYETNPGPITDPSIAGYRFDGNCVDLYVNLSELGKANPSCINLTWATDQENPNLEQAPTTDSADSYNMPIHIAPIIDVIKTDSPDPVEAGNNITYTVTIINSGNMDLLNGTGNEFEDPIPADTSYAPGTIAIDGVPNDDDITDGVGYDSGNIIWNGVVSAGGSVSIVFQVTVDSPLPNGTQISNQGMVYWDSDGDGTNDASEPSDDPLTTGVDDDPTITTVHSAPVLMITKDDYPDPVTPGETLTYTIIYENTGNEVATNVVITETYDANVTFVSATPAPDSGNNIWIFSSLSPADGQQTITIDVTVNLPLDDGTILNNYVNITCDEGVSEDDTEETTVNSTAVVIFGKADHPDPVPAGGALTYTLTYQNTGTANATDVMINDTLPDEVTYDSADPLPTSVTDGTLTWDIGEIAPDGPHTITINVTVKSPIANGTVITNNATITCSLGSCSEAEQTTIVSAPILNIEKTDSPDPVEAGGTLTYVITVTNTGNANATSVTIIDDYDQTNLTIINAGGGVDNGDTITWIVAELAAGAPPVSYTVTATVASPLENGIFLFNPVSVSCEQGVTASTTAITTVHSAPKLTVAKSDSPDPVEAGGQLTYTITYENIGNAVTFALAITDCLPDEVTYISADPPPTSLVDNTLTWEIGELSPEDGQQTITITVRVDSLLADGTILENCVNIWCCRDVGPIITEDTTVRSAPVPVGGGVFAVDKMAILALAGDDMHPANKLAIVAPWIALGIVIAVGAAIAIRQHRAQG